MRITKIADEVAPAQLWLLGAVGAVKALGLVLVAEALATGTVAVIGHRPVGNAVLLGVVGALLRGFAVWASRVAAERTAAGVKQRLRADLAAVLLRRDRGPVGSSAALGSGGLDELDAYYTTFLPAVMNAVTVPLLVGARILFADWLSAVVIVLTLPLVPLFMALIGMHTRDRVAAATDALGRLSDHFVELARGLPVLVGLGRVDEQTRALAEISEDYRVASMRTMRTAFLSALALELISTISVAVVAVLIGIRLLSGDMTLEAGLIALILAPECFGPFREVGSAFHASDAGREALRRVKTMLGAPIAAGVFVRRVPAGARANRLTVRYAGRTVPAVHALTFQAAAGEITLLNGPSGCGKSTVLALLAGRGAALDPDAACTGTIALEPAERIAWMPQHPHAIGATARDELVVYGIDDPGSADDILARVGLLPDSHPGAFSPGELRLLAFARVLARVAQGATLILLDEPTAHLDEVNARRVRDELAGLRRRVTVIVASHDPDVQALADRSVPVGGERHGARQVNLPSSTPNGKTATTDAPLGTPGPRDPARRTLAHSGTQARQGVARRELTALLRPVAGRFAAAAGVGALAAGFALALTVVSGWLIVRASQEPAIMYLLVAIVGVRFFGIGRSVLRYSERLLTHDAVFRALTTLRVRLWRGLARRGPAGRAALAPAHALSTLVGDADRVRDLAPRVVAPPIVGVLTLVGVAIALGVIYPPSAIVIGVLAGVTLVVVPAWGVLAARTAGRANEAARSTLMRALAGALDAAGELTANGADAAVRRRLGVLDASAAATSRHGAAIEGISGGLIAAACALAAVVMLPLSAAAVAGGTLNPAVVAVLTLTPLALTEPLRDVTSAARQWPALAHVLRRVARVTTQTDDAVDPRPRVTDDPIVRATSRPSVTAHGASIALDDVGYRYPGAAADVFDGLRAEVGAGGWLVVTGPSGSGKSTMLGLLMRYLQPSSGRCLLDGRDLAGFERSAVLQRVAWCPQEGHLFNSTLRANLTIARPRGAAPSDAELIDALERVGLGDVLASLPHGLDTMIGSEGGRLSGGQRQRVAVARTLLRGGDVVLIDEPTAHVDEQASNALMQDLRVALRGRTTVLITHRTDDIRASDAVLRLGRPAGAPESSAAPATHGLAAAGSHVLATSPLNMLNHLGDTSKLASLSAQSHVGGRP